MRIVLSFLALLFCLSAQMVACGVTGGFMSSDPTTNRIVDDAGRERFFHGVNVVVKGQPYVPIVDHFDTVMSYSEEDASTLEMLGFNIIRLGVMWPGVEPQRAVYNDTYLGLIADIVNISARHGIYSLFDYARGLVV